MLFGDSGSPKKSVMFNVKSVFEAAENQKVEPQSLTIAVSG